MWNRISLYIIRKNKKTVLLLMLTLVITTILITCLSMKRSSVDELRNLRESFGGSFTVDIFIDWQNSADIKLVENKNGGFSRLYVGPQVNQEIVEAISSLEGIEDYSAQLSLYMYVPDTEIVHAGSWNLYTEMVEEPYDGLTAWDYDYWNMRTRVPNFVGNINTEYNYYFRTGAIELIEGHHIKEGDKRKVLISETIAELNGLEVGDSIHAIANAAIWENGPVEEIMAEFDFEIVGIYRTNSQQEITYYTVEYDILDNFFFIDMNSIMDAGRGYTGGDSQYFESATFFVKDPKELDSIIEQAKELDVIKGKSFQFDIDDTVYQESVSILKTLNLVLTILIAVIIISCLAILSIILTMWIQNRGREAGILLSIGIERREIIAQFMAECLIIGLIAVVMAAGVSSAISKPVSNAVLSMITPEEQEIETKSKEELTQELLEGNFDNLGGEIHTEVKLPEEFNSTVTIGDILLVLLIESLLIIVTVYLACYRVLWMKPKDILTMMS